MGIQINGTNDTISAGDGSWDAKGASINTSGILTATTFSGNITGAAATVTTLSGTSATFSGPVTIGGTLTYEDVTNIDSIGIITARSDIHIGDKIVHIGDTNTAIRFPAADTIAAETAGSERARIDSGGRVLIGTTTVGEATADDLTIATSGSTGITIRSGTGNAGNIQFGDGTSGDDQLRGIVQYHHSDNSMRFSTNASEKLRIDSNGRLLVGGTGNTDTDIRLYIHNSGAAGSQLQFTGNASGTSNSDGFRVGYNGSGGQLWLFENQFVRIATNNTERFRLDNTGRITAGNSNVGTSNDASEWFKVQSNNSAANISIVGSNDTHSSLNLGDEDDFNIQKIRSDHTNNSLQFFTADAERFRIDSTGKVGINNTSPDRTLDLISAQGGNCDIELKTSNNTGWCQLIFSDTDAAYRGGIGYQHVNNLMAFYTNAGNERMRIDAGGSVSIGDASTHTYSAHSEGDDLVIGGAGWRGMTIYGEGGGGVIQFADNADNRVGQLMYNHSDNSMIFRTGGNQTRMQIKSDGQINFDGSSSSTITYQFLNGTSGASADTRLLIKAYANSGADPYIKFDAGGSDMVVGTKYEGTTNNKLVMGAGASPSGGVAGIQINGSGHVLPDSNNTRDLGSTGQGWRNVYMNDLQLSNVNGDTNDVDGTQGTWTIQEGSDDLFIINRLNGKKYRFNLTEVS